MAKTKEEILEKIQAAIDDPQVSEISDIHQIANLWSNDFFKDIRYRIQKAKGSVVQTLTEFTNPKYIEPVLKLLNSKAASKHAKGFGTTTYTLKDLTGINDMVFADVIWIKCTPAAEEIIATRGDTGGSYTFKSIDELNNLVFLDGDERFEPFKTAFAKGIKKRLASAKSEVKGNETRLKNSKKVLKAFDELYKQVPDELKLLTELEDM